MNALLGEITFTFEDLQILARDALDLNASQRDIIRTGADEIVALLRMNSLLSLEIASQRQKIEALTDQINDMRREKEKPRSWSMSGTLAIKFNTPAW